jgi:TolB-like protein
VTSNLHASGFDKATITSAALIRDNLLRGTENIGEAYGDWLRDTRIRLHDQALAPLLQLIESAHCDVEQRKVAADAALMIDTLCEPACRVAMQIAAEAGDLNRALTLYSRLYEEMGRVLDMEPSDATQDLAVRVKMGGFGKQPVPEPPLTGAMHRPTMSLGGQPVIVVLPFQTQGPDNIPDGLPELLAEDVVSEIAGVREMSVISMNSAQKFGAVPIDFDQLHKRLHVDYVLTAKLRRTGAIYRLSFQLCDARTGLVVWARVLTPSEDQLFSAQSRMAEDVVNTLTPSLRAVELMLHSNYKLSDLTAYHLTLRARDLIFGLTKAQFDAAGPLLQQAITKEPQFALAHQYLADWYSLRLGQGWSPDPKADIDAMMAAARTAIKLPGNPGRATAMLAHNLVIYARSFSEAMPLFDTALTLAPKDAETIMWSSPALAYSGNTEAAIDRASAAIQLSPEDPLMFRFEHFLSIAKFAHGDYAAAERFGRNAMARNPKYSSNLRVTAAAIAAQGKHDDLDTIRQAVLEQEPDFRVSKLEERAPFQLEAQRKHFGDLLRCAGFQN